MKRFKRFCINALLNHVRTAMMIYYGHDRALMNIMNLMLNGHIPDIIDKELD